MRGNLRRALARLSSSARRRLRYAHDLGQQDTKDGNVFCELNKDCRLVNTLSDDAARRIRDAWAPMMHAMLSGVPKCPLLRNVKVYRGRPNLASELREVYTQGKQVLWCGWTSTTTDKQKAAYTAAYKHGLVLEMFVDVG